MVVTTWLVLFLVCSGDGAADAETAPALIARLGSPRFADREGATEALTGMGREALAHLRTARRAADPEIQNRIEGVIDRIERSQLHSPKLVKLAGGPKPVGHWIRQIEEETGFPLEIERGSQPNWLEKLVEPKQAQATSFWETLEQLGLDATWSIDRENAAFRTRSLPVLSVTHRSSTVAPSIDGPFRFAFRDLRLVPRAQGGGRVFAPGRPTAVRPARGLLDMQF